MIARAPLVTGEMGENDCAHGFIDTVMAWLDARSASYIGWAWDANFDCRTGRSFISGCDGTQSGFGIGLRDHLATLRFP